MSAAEIIRPGSRVTLHYTLTLADGDVIDSTREGEPVSLVIGQGDLVEFLEKRLIGLAVGEHRELRVTAADSRGAHPQAVQEMARTDLPAGFAPEPGEVIGFAMPNGEEIPGHIVAVNDEQVFVDFSHPLSGRDLVFDVDILSVANH